jgi:hypothetical protein
MCISIVTSSRHFILRLLHIYHGWKLRVIMLNAQNAAAAPLLRQCRAVIVIIIIILFLNSTLKWGAHARTVLLLLLLLLLERLIAFSEFLHIAYTKTTILIKKSFGTPCG